MAIYNGVSGTGKLISGDGEVPVKIIGVTETGKDTNGNPIYSYLTETTFSGSSKPELRVYSAQAFKDAPSVKNDGMVHNFTNNTLESYPSRDKIVDALMEKANYEGKNITRDEAISEFNDYQWSNDVTKYSEMYDKIKEDTKKIDPNSYYMKSDEYSEVHQSGLNTENPNGTLSADIKDNHDQFMNASRTTRTGGIGTTAEQRATGAIKIDEDGNVVVDKDGKAIILDDKLVKKDNDGNIKSINGITREKTLANEVTIEKFNDDTKGLTFSSDSAYLKDTSKRLWNVDDISNMSKAELEDIFEASGQFHPDDYDKMFKAYDSVGWQKHGKSASKKPFYGTPLENTYNSLKSQNISAESLVADYSARLDNYKSQWDAIHEQIEGWMGSASAAEKDCLEEVMGIFDKAIEHLEGTMKESAQAFDTFMAETERLKSMVDNELTPAEEAAQKANDDLDKCMKDQPEWHTREEKEQQYNYRTHEWDTVTKRVTNPAWAPWEARKTQLEAAKTEAEAHLAKVQQKINDQQSKVQDSFRKWSNYDEYITNFGDYFTGHDGKKGSRADWFKDKNSVVNHFNSDFNSYGKGFKDDLSDFTRFPVLDALSKYKKGMKLTFDDAHGQGYEVYDGFDPFTGTIQIIHIGADGKPDGKPITIWDQREIWPVDSEYAYHKQSGGDTPTPPTIAPTTPKPKPTTPPPGGNPTSPPPGGNPTSPPPGASPTTPPIGTTPGTLPGTTPVPGVPVTTTPGTSPNIPGIVPSTDPTYFAPHTGLDAVYTVNGNGDTKQSNSSIGALAGLAMGAAGLGLTGLIGDKDKKEDEDKKEENIESEKEEKKEETIQNDSIESNNNQQEPEIKEFNNILEQK